MWLLDTRTSKCKGLKNICLESLRNSKEVSMAGVE